jgi:hypothetical protein
MDLMVGRLQVNPSGFGFVAPDRKGDAEAHPDIYIPAFALAEAMHGDTVVVRVEKQTDKGFEGRLVKILQRAHERIVGASMWTAPGSATWCRSTAASWPTSRFRPARPHPLNRATWCRHGHAVADRPRVARRAP